ncbi:MAG: alpha/beta hydrolase, partial [Ilumatobacteraceae bacterium]
MTSSILAGAESWSHVGDSDHGALVLHGFTGNPSSMRGIATALAAKGFHIEMPLLPGHGTVVDDMMPTRWADWAGEAEAAYQRLSQRVGNMVVVGLSMGGALTLRIGADHADVAGLVC